MQVGAGFRPALVAGIGCLLAANAGGQPESCDEGAATEAERQTCRLIRACAAIDDAERRQECFRAVVAGEGDAAVADESDSLASEPAPSPAPTPQVTVEGKVTAQVTEEREAPQVVTAEPKVYEVLTIPENFTGTVTAIHDSGRNRRLIALDAKLLFESDQAGEGRLRIGDEARVVKTSAFFGERYRITGPSRRPFPAGRIRCERTDLNQANRRRCSLLSRD